MSRPKTTAAGPARPGRIRLSPKKLLLSKWTAVCPQQREKHFLVVRLVEPEPPATAVTMVELEAVLSKRVAVLPWRDLTDPGRWIQGWR